MWDVFEQRTNKMGLVLLFRLTLQNIWFIQHCSDIPHPRVRGSFPGFGSLKETKMFFPHPLVRISIVGSLREREVACSASDLQVLNFESCIWREVSPHSSHHPQEVLPTQFSRYVHKSDLKPDSFYFTMCALTDKIYKSMVACDLLNREYIVLYKCRQ